MRKTAVLSSQTDWLLYVYVTCSRGSARQKAGPNDQLPMNAVYGVTGTAVTHITMSDTDMFTRYIRVFIHRLDLQYKPFKLIHHTNCTVIFTLECIVKICHRK